MDGRIGINDRIVAVNCVNLTRATRQEVRSILFWSVLYTHIDQNEDKYMREPLHATRNTNEIQQQGKHNFVLIYSRSEFNERMNNTFRCIKL